MGVEKKLGRIITLLGRKSQLYIGAALKKYNITAAEQPFFTAMQFHKGCTQEELTALVCVDKATTARALKSLEEKGFVHRVQDTRDRRQNRIYPTPAANQLVKSVVEELLRFDRILTEDIEPERLKLVYDTLQKMDENISGVKTQEGGCDNEKD